MMVRATLFFHPDSGEMTLICPTCHSYIPNLTETKSQENYCASCEKCRSKHLVCVSTTTAFRCFFLGKGGGDNCYQPLREDIIIGPEYQQQHRYSVGIVKGGTCTECFKKTGTSMYRIVKARGFCIPVSALSVDDKNDIVEMLSLSSTSYGLLVHQKYDSWTTKNIGSLLLYNPAECQDLLQRKSVAATDEEFGIPVYPPRSDFANTDDQTFADTLRGQLPQSIQSLCQKKEYFCEWIFGVNVLE
eukprot:GILJ01013477.1.p1 GENE.GILJ01013477.1~~GILJ01013477.1.p1  ORF type:complete len:245 (+),score=20.97 GILJ01013477.1:216-950(+)